MDRIASFHTELVWIIVAVCLFVLALLVYIVVKFRAGANPCRPRCITTPCWKWPGP